MRILFKIQLLAFVSMLYACSDQPIENHEVYTQNQVAVSGFDLVSYFTAEAPILGSTKHAVELDGVIYRFTNAENKSAFEADTEKYLPAYGGWCAYAMANDGSLMSSNPDKYEIQDGKLYLFFDNFITSIQGGLQKEWNSDSEAYKTKADDNWEEHLKSTY
ncbi:MAG: YHS domain-containing (seleno)protein [Reichenbachiella sp.]|uniref:YHS domain-containing (seleno)protein n=1 Tax=Reichenbachiella sp. TaxID=2184521 RepID=UPI003266B01F